MLVAETHFPPLNKMGVSGILAYVHFWALQTTHEGLRRHFSPYKSWSPVGQVCELGTQDHSGSIITCLSQVLGVFGRALFWVLITCQLSSLLANYSHSSRPYTALCAVWSRCGVSGIVPSKNRYLLKLLNYKSMGKGFSVILSGIFSGYTLIS